MKYFKYVLLLVGLTSLLGCQTVNTSQRDQPRSNPTIVADQRIITDTSLKSKAQVLQVREGKVGNGLLKIQAEIYNDSYNRQRVNFRFEWMDESGLVIDTNLSRWTPLILAGKESSWVSAVAPTPRAVDFRLKLIESTN